MSWRGQSFDSIWDAELVEMYIDFAKSDRDDINNYIQRAKRRLKEIQSITWKKFVEITRHTIPKTEYTIRVRVEAEDDPRKYDYLRKPRYCQRITDRKEALDYAETLAWELGAEIVRRDF